MPSPDLHHARAEGSTRGLDSWIEVAERALAGNLAFVRRLIGPEVELSSVVKSNAYGHGMELVAGVAAREGADSFCVHSLDEALRLRRAGFDQEILVMGHVPFARLEEAVAESLRLVLYHVRSARELAEITRRTGRSIQLHLKIETGTHRQGIEPEDLDPFVELFARHPGLVAEGIYTHFANIEDTTDHSYARRQLARFEETLERLRNAGLPLPKVHTACSAAALLFPETHFSMVRLGISQYGLWPSKETYLSYRLEHPDSEFDLSPALTWKARISQVKWVPAGAYIGYGCTYQATRDTRIAILPVGYADGYDRRLSNQAHVLIHGRRAPVRGRICMNLFMVDVTDLPEVEVEDEAVLLGSQGEQQVSAADLAAWVGTIPYEIVARIGAHIPRLAV